MIVHILLADSMKKLDESWSRYEKILTYHQQMREALEDELEIWLDEVLAVEPVKVPESFQKWIPFAATPGQERFPIVWACMPTVARLMGRIAQKDPGTEPSIADIQPCLLYTSRCV